MKNLMILLFLPVMLSAQLISIKTVPVATGNQFLVFPSENLGMGGISIALDDYSLDSFINPAKGSRIRGVSIFSAPAFYSISSDYGSAKTLPFGVLFGSNSWFGSAMFTFQQLKSINLNQMEPNINLKRSSSVFSDNHYLFGMLGKNLIDSKTSIAASIFWADLNAIGGVDLLYVNSDNIDQFGNMCDIRLGLYHKMKSDQTLEVMFLYNRLNMTYKVTNTIWSRVTQIETRVTQIESHLDRTRTYGLHLGYTRPLLQKLWYIGGNFTVNWKSHPKIPNYELMNIPRDPGNSRAYNYGIGLSKITKLSTVGIDLIYEPIWSNTWADAIESVRTISGKMINKGEKTIENDFEFSNFLLKIGLYTHEQPLGFQIGLQMHLVKYWLDQNNYIEEFRRKQKERWTEWAATWGLIFKIDDIQIRYFGRLILGTGRPSVSGNNIRGVDFDVNASDFLVAPSGPLLLQEEHVFLHQVTVSIPFHN